MHLLDILSLQLPAWAQVASFLELSDLQTVSVTCAYLRDAVADDSMWHRRWVALCSYRSFGDVPLGAASWREAFQHLVLLREPAIVAEEDKCAGESNILFNVTYALHSDGGLRAYGYSDGTVRVLRRPPHSSGACTTSTAAAVHPAQDGRVYRLGSGSIRHMQLSEDGLSLYVGCWAGAVHCLDLSPALGFTSPVSDRATDRAAGEGGEGGAEQAQEPAAAGQAMPEGRHRRIVTGLRGPVYALRLERGSLYTGCGDGTIQAWNAVTGASLGTLEGHTEGVTDFCAMLLPLPASASARWGQSRAEHVRLLISSSYDGTLRVWRALRQDGGYARVGYGGRGQSSHSSSGSASSSSTSALPAALCVPPTFRPLLTLTGHRGPVWTVAAQGTRIISGAADSTVRIWEIRAVGAAALFLEGRCSHVLQHAFAPGAAPAPAVAMSSGDGPAWSGGWMGGEVNDTGTATVARDADSNNGSGGVTSALPGLHSRKQVWCLKLAGPLIVTGASDGQISCWDSRSGALLWCAPGPGCMDGKDGVRRLDIVRDTLYTTTRHGNIGIARLSHPAKGLPAPVAAPVPVSVTAPMVGSGARDTGLAQPVREGEGGQKGAGEAETGRPPALTGQGRQNNSHSNNSRMRSESTSSASPSRVPALPDVVGVGIGVRSDAHGGIDGSGTGAGAGSGPGPAAGSPKQTADRVVVGFQPGTGAGSQPCMASGCGLQAPAAVGSGAGTAAASTCAHAADGSGSPRSTESATQTDNTASTSKMMDTSKGSERGKQVGGQGQQGQEQHHMLRRLEMDVQEGDSERGSPDMVFRYVWGGKLEGDTLQAGLLHRPGALGLLSLPLHHPSGVRPPPSPVRVGSGPCSNLKG